jgi:hypothetical protein
VHTFLWEKNMKRIFAILLLMITAAACSDSDKATGPEEITIDDLVGSWTASSQVYTNNASPAEKFDLIGAGGETRITVLPGGGARTWVTFGTFSDEWDAQLTLSGGTLTSQPVEASRGVRNWTFTLDGNILTLTDTNSAFDFTLSDAAEVPATVVVILVRQ